MTDLGDQLRASVAITSRDNIVSTCLDALDLIESGIASEDQVLSAINFVARLSEIRNTLKTRLDTATIRYIQKNGPIQDGPRRYYVAPNKTTRCVSVRDTLHALLETTGGDLDTLTECLSSGAFKPAATKKILGEKATALFETKTTDKLTAEGEPEPKLQIADERFTG